MSNLKQTLYEGQWVRLSLIHILPIHGEARRVLADAADARLRGLEPLAGDAVLEKLRSRFTLPPLTIAIIATLGEDEKIPASERFSTASCVAFQLLQAAHAEGFGAQWLTGWPAYDRPFLEHTLGPVSYTHLDVYKRQATCRPRPPWCPR